MKDLNKTPLKEILIALGKNLDGPPPEFNNDDIEHVRGMLGLFILYKRLNEYLAGRGNITKEELELIKLSLEVLSD